MATEFEEIKPATRKQQAKKRARVEPLADDKTELKQRARKFCKTIEEWDAIKDSSASQLTDFINEQEFIRQKQISANVFDASYKMFSTIVDKISMGDTYVYEQVANDLSLRVAIEEEFSEYLQFLTNRLRIAALLMVDVFQGKRTQIKNTPVVEEVIEKNEHHQEDDQKEQETELSSSSNQQ